MRADIGIALDGDADRVVIADEHGHLVDGDQLLAVIAESWREDGLLTKPGIVATVMSNLGLERHLQSLKLTLVRTPVGDRYVLEHMREHGYNVGGEQSGPHHSVGLHHDRRRLRRRAAGAGGGEEEGQAGLGSLPPLRAAAAGAAQRALPQRQAARTSAKVRSAIADAESRLNGHGRLVVRPSGTEPVIRIMGEGDDTVLVEDVVDFNRGRPDRRGGRLRPSFSAYAAAPRTRSMTASTSSGSASPRHATWPSGRTSTRRRS